MTPRLYGLVAAAFVLTASGANAQQHALDRGSIQLGGSASLTSTGSDGDDTGDRATTASLNPRLHYFFAERLAIGADLVLGYTNFPGDNSSWSVGIGPSITYYFGTPPRSVHPYLSAGASIAKVSFDNPLGDTDGSRRSASADAGILALLSRSVGLTMELFYLIEHQEFEGLAIPPIRVENDTNTFGLAVGIAAFVF